MYDGVARGITSTVAMLMTLVVVAAACGSTTEETTTSAQQEEGLALRSEMLAEISTALPLDDSPLMLCPPVSGIEGAKGYVPDDPVHHAILVDGDLVRYPHADFTREFILEELPRLIAVGDMVSFMMFQEDLPREWLARRIDELQIIVCVDSAMGPKLEVCRYQDGTSYQIHATDLRIEAFDAATGELVGSQDLTAPDASDVGCMAYKHSGSAKFFIQTATPDAWEMQQTIGLLVAPPSWAR